MKLIILLLVVVIIVAFLFYVSRQESKFHYSLTTPLNASAEKVFPYISDLKLGGEWSPFEKVDPNMKKEFIGNNKMIFKGNREAGAGSIEILKVVPNERVELKLIMTEPFKAENDVVYKLEATPSGVNFTWSMSGDSGFMGKVVNVFIDCEKMILKQFAKGAENLKAIVEK